MKRKKSKPMREFTVSEQKLFESKRFKNWFKREKKELREDFKEYSFGDETFNQFAINTYRAEKESKSQKGK